MKNSSFLLLFLLSTLLYAQDDLLPFQNPNLSIEERTEDLISHMTLEEKVAQLM